MPSRRPTPDPRYPAISIAVLVLAILACSRERPPLPTSEPGAPTPTPIGACEPPCAPALAGGGALEVHPIATHSPRLPNPDGPPTPTPDPTRPARPTRATVEEYFVQAGDTLGTIADKYGLTLEDLIQANPLADPNLLSVGQVLQIPPQSSNLLTGPGFKLIPDSELVYSPSAIGFSVQALAAQHGGYLVEYGEEVEGEYIGGPDLVQLVAERYSVNPRLLLAALEYQSGWVTQPTPRDSTLTYPMGRVEAYREGLYRQLAWAADQLNAGYYLWQVGAVNRWTFPDGQSVFIEGGVNAGTAGVQRLFATLYNFPEWSRIVSPDGFVRAYEVWFGYPFQYAIEPLIPVSLAQPELSLPIEPGKEWAFTSGPHGGWDSGSGWAALDLAPPADFEGCTISNEWVVAAAPGKIVRSARGSVVQDLNGDGVEQTGWALLYHHLEERDRVPVGATVQAGDRLGHPSCEGGFANGTHLHFARKYNGQWIAADGAIPFILDGWVSVGSGREYDGFLVRGEMSIEACDCRSFANTIRKP